MVPDLSPDLRDTLRIKVMRIRDAGPTPILP